ncbi:MAG: hypothetical protein ACRD1C_03790 [Terriglobales bacterium]
MIRPSFPLLALGLAGLLANWAPTQKPVEGGVVVASAFGHWQAIAQGPVLGTGQPEGATLEGIEASFTLENGQSFQPLAAGVPITITGSGVPETTTILGVSCRSGGVSCSVSADFSQPHPGHFTISSGSDGLQEAINWQAGRSGGIVVLDPAWTGNLTTLLPLIRLPSNVLLIDERAGNWTAYGLGDGGSPEVIASFSSASGVSLASNPATTSSSLNGVLFAHAYNFAAPTPGVSLTAATAATVTPAWALPAGVVAGDTLYISGGTGTAETVTVTNVGEACPAGGAASVCFTPAYSHSGAWTLASATAGLEEAVNAAGPGGWVVDDEPVADVYAPLVLAAAVRLTGFAAFDGGQGTEISQLTPATDAIQIGTPSTTANNVALEHLIVSGVNASSGAAIHCVNCVHTEIKDVVGRQAHDGIYFDSTYGHAYDAEVSDSHFIDDYYGVHIVGASANRLTFTGNTVDDNAYGVFDDGGWVHTWMGNDIESNSQYGYWQQVSDPAAWSGRSVDLIGNYFESNGSNVAGQGDVFLGQLVDGGTGNNGGGCEQCVVNGNIFNASLGGNVTALNFGAVSVTLDGNDYSGYGTGQRYATITGPSPNYSYVLSLGDGAAAPLNGASPEGFGGAAAGDISRVDSTSALVLGGTDRLTDIHGTMLTDTTLESPTGIIRFRGKPGGEAANNPAQLLLDGNSSGTKQDNLIFRNAGISYWEINSDIAGDGGDTFCLATNLVNPASGECQLYVGPDAHFQFSGLTNAPTGDINPAGDYTFRQMANGDSGLMIMRDTDTSPTGYLLDIEDSTDSQPLVRVDASGNITGNGTLNIAGAATFQSTAAMAAGSTVGGQPINTTAPILRGASGTYWRGTYTAGTCISGGISFASGVSVGMVAAGTPESAPPAGLVWNAYIDASDHVTVNVCNITSSSVVWTGGTIFEVAVIP